MYVNSLKYFYYEIYYLGTKGQLLVACVVHAYIVIS